MTKKSKIPAPWEFDPSSADQRSAPSAGAGDYYGMGIKQKMGRVLSEDMQSSNPPPKQLKKPPKKLA